MNSQYRGISGLEVLKYAKAKQPETKVIMLTGYSEYEEKAKKLECDAFMKKPVAFNDLEITIVSLLETKSQEEIKEYSLDNKILKAPKGAPQ